jgi:hypothetical protein
MQTLLATPTEKRPDRRTQVREQADRRTEPRLLVDEPATLDLLQPSAGGRIDVQILDISQSGVGLRSTRILPTGALVHICIRSTIVAIGQVRHTTRVNGEYFSGVLLEHAAVLGAEPRPAAARNH